MKKIQFKETSIAIECDGGFSTISNEIRYTISANLVDAEALQSLFPNNNFNLVDGKLSFGGTATLNNMWDVINTVAIEQSDVNKIVKEAIVIWSTNIVYGANLLGINQADWSIVE